MNISTNATRPETNTKENSMKKRTIVAALAAVAVALTIPLTYAQMGAGPGMMGSYGQGRGGYGPGMMGSYGQGQGGYGPGMMYGYGQGQGGYGPGMMGGYGMGPAMMYGYGAGTTGSYGMGPGMMHGWGADYLGALDLSDDQREKITRIEEGLSTKHWELMGEMQQQQFRLRQLMASGKADDAAVGKTYKRLEELRQQMWTAAADAQKQVDASLTKAQRDQLARGRDRDGR